MRTIINIIATAFLFSFVFVSCQKETNNDLSKSDLELKKIEIEIKNNTSNKLNLLSSPLLKPAKNSIPYSELKAQANTFETNTPTNSNLEMLDAEECLTIMGAANLDFSTKEGQDFYLKCRNTEGKP